MSMCMCRVIIVIISIIVMSDFDIFVFVAYVIRRVTEIFEQLFILLHENVVFWLDVQNLLCGHTWNVYICVH